LGESSAKRWAAMSTPATITSTLQRFFIGRIPCVAAIADYCAHATLSSLNGLNLDRFFGKRLAKRGILALDEFSADEKVVHLLNCQPCSRFSREVGIA
jgi:hypothetical protein